MPLPYVKPKPAAPKLTQQSLLSIEGDSTKTIEQQRKDEAFSGKGFKGMSLGASTLNKFNKTLTSGLAAQPAPADDPALLAAAAREMQLRRMSRGRGGTVLSGTSTLG